MSLSSVGARRASPILFASVLFTGVAAGQTAPRHGPASDATQSAADGLFTEGRDLLEKGRFAEACAKLARSEELAPAVGTLLNLAYCYEQRGLLRSAMDAYVEAETLALAAGEAKRAAFARERYVAVEPRTPKLVLRATSPESGLEVRRNGVLVPRSDLDHAIPVDAEDYVITATAPSRLPYRSAFVLRGEGAVITIIIPPLLPVGGAAEAASPALGARRLAALGLGAASALSLGAGVALGLSARARYDDARDHCDPSGCDAVGATLQHGAVAQGNVATGLLLFGALFGGAGAYLWLVSEPKPAARPATLGVGPQGVAVVGAF
jgi:hypothetical protein